MRKNQAIILPICTWAKKYPRTRAPPMSIHLHFSIMPILSSILDSLAINKLILQSNATVTVGNGTSAGNVNINGSGFSDVKFYVKGSDATGSNYAALFVRNEVLSTLRKYS